jgi:hypothetical protein
MSLHIYKKQGVAATAPATQNTSPFNGWGSDVLFLHTALQGSPRLQVPVQFMDLQSISKSDVNVLISKLPEGSQPMKHSLAQASEGNV